MFRPLYRLHNVWFLRRYITVEVNEVAVNPDPNIRNPDLNRNYGKGGSLIDDDDPMNDSWTIANFYRFRWIKMNIIYIGVSARSSAL